MSDELPPEYTPAYSVEVPGTETVQLKDAVRLLSHPELVIDRVTTDGVNHYTIGDHDDEVYGFIESVEKVRHTLHGFAYNVVSAAEREPVMSIKSIIPVFHKFAKTGVYSLEETGPKLVGISRTSGYLDQRTYNLYQRKSNFCSTSQPKGPRGRTIFKNERGVVASIDYIRQDSISRQVAARYVLRMTPAALAGTDWKIEVSQEPLTIDERALLLATVLNLDTDMMYDPRGETSTSPIRTLPTPSSSVMFMTPYSMPRGPGRSPRVGTAVSSGSGSSSRGIM